MVFLNPQVYLPPFKFSHWHKTDYFVTLILSQSENSSLPPFEYIYKLTLILQNDHVNVNISGEYELEISIVQELEQNHEVTPQ